MNNILYPMNESDKGDLNEEEMDYFIDTISNDKESIEHSEKNSDIENNINNDSRKKKKEDRIDKKNYTKEEYIKNLEQKLMKQEEQISKLIDNQNKYERKLKQMEPSFSIPIQKKISYDNLNTNFNSNNKNNPHKRNSSYNHTHLNNIRDLKKQHNIPKYNKSNSELDMNNISSSDIDKYDKLYSNYIKVINDYKNLSNNSVSTNEYTRLKTQFNELKNRNNSLIKQIQDERNKSNNNINENEIIKDLKDQVETFRKELVLSQAMVNSLRAELDQINKNRLNNNNTNNNIDDINYNNINNIDSDGNLNGNNYKNRIPFKYNDDDNNNNINDNKLKQENENLKMSLKNNNLLLSKVLEENNKLRENRPDYQNLNNQNINDNNEEINYLKNNLSQYEDKFGFFNDYINNIKNKIKNIYDDLLSVTCKYDKPDINKKFSPGFIKKLQDLKSDINRLKGIDRFNLDSADDEKCLQLYMDLVKLLLNELENKSNKINELNRDINNMNDKINNNNNYQKIANDKTKKQLTDLIDIIKQYIDDTGVKQLINDYLNIVDNLSNLYKLKNDNNNYNDINNINQKILEDENELEYIKKLLLNQINNYNNKNVQLTYTMNYNSPKLESKYLGNNGYYFQYD